MKIFSGKTVDDAWLQAAKFFRQGDGVRVHNSRGGQTLELLQGGFSIKEPRQRWVLSRTPALNPAFAIAEVVWILNGRNDSAFLNFWNRQLPEFAGKARQYHGAYGFRLRKHLGIDQLDRAFYALKSKPNTRQIVLQIWDSRVDFPYKTGKEISKDVPCNIVSLLQIRDYKLEWTQIIRSNDLFRGVPYNFIQFTYLQEVIAGWLGIDVGSYNQISNSLHIYEKDKQNVFTSRRIGLARNTDSISLPKRTSEKLFSELSTRVDSLINRNLSKATLMKLSSWKAAPEAFKNILLILSSESARRRKWLSLVTEIMNDCTNPLFCQLWNRWMMRHTPK